MDGNSDTITQIKVLIGPYCAKGSCVRLSICTPVTTRFICFIINAASHLKAACISSEQCYTTAGRSEEESCGQSPSRCLFCWRFWGNSIHAGLQINEDMEVSVLEHVRRDASAPRSQSTSFHHSLSGVDESLLGKSSPHTILAQSEKLNSFLSWQKTRKIEKWIPSKKNVRR